MSGPGGSKPPPQDGITQNSALSFLARAQASNTNAGAQSAAMFPEHVLPGASAALPNMPLPEPAVPPGVKTLLDMCSEVYPDQPNPLQVTTRLKYWLGGSDPLDYISMYWHGGDTSLNVPPHWHYISFGLTDLHGDGRVHPIPPARPPNEPPPPSGLGFELTLRVCSEPGSPPPIWPAALMQGLARYISATGNKIEPGDHITWHNPIDGARSRLTHLLAAADPTLRSSAQVAFVQLVGCTNKELRAAQLGSAFDVLESLKEDPKTGGTWLVTCPGRTRSRTPRAPRSSRPSPLAGVSAPLRVTTELDEERSQELSQTISEQIKQTLRRGLNSMSDSITEQEGHMSTDSFEMSSIERALPYVPGLNEGYTEAVRYPKSVHMTLTREGASLLPLAIDGRVRHGRHFTLRGSRHVTLLARGVTHSRVTTTRPYALQGDWLQVLIPPDLAEEMSTTLAPLARLSNETDSSASETDDSGRAGRERDNDIPTLPVTYDWPQHRLKITVVEDGFIL